MGIIELDRSLIPACDVQTLEQLEKIARVAKEFPQVQAYKIGASLGLRYGLPMVVDAILSIDPSAITIYDHQKAGTDIQETAEGFAAIMVYADIDAAIIFPMAGPATQAAYIEKLQERGIGVICGGEMTHSSYKESEGGYITDDAPERMYGLAAELGVEDFVVPGNKANSIQQYRKLIEERGIVPTFYSPGLITQGGDITKAGQAAGKHWHAICGRAVYNPNSRNNLDDVTEDEMHKSIEKLVSKL